MVVSMTRERLRAEPGRIYPAWRDGRRITGNGPTLHAVTDQPSGHTRASGFLALCGRPVRFKVEDEFLPDDDQACIECAALVVVANTETHRRYDSDEFGYVGCVVCDRNGDTLGWPCPTVAARGATDA